MNVKSIVTTQYSMRPIRLLGIVLSVMALATIVAVAFTESPERVAHLPENFVRETLVTGLSLPTDMAFLPNGDLLVAEKGQGGDEGSATIYLVQDVHDAPILIDILTIATNPYIDGGVLGIVPDPDFASNNYFYVYYSSTGTSVKSPFASTSKNRVSRFTYDPASQVADPASELILIDDMLRAESHNGGGMVFDDDGNLYITTGDHTSYAFDNHPSPDLSQLYGKVLRIRPNATGYTIPADNPYIDHPTALPEVYASGLRNPFRMSRASTGEILIGDVGNTEWEEISLLEKGADFGWPEREGPCRLGKLLPCDPSSAAYTDPIVYYLHETGSENEGGAVTGLTIYEGSTFPAEYHRKLFFVDADDYWLGVSTLDGGFYEAPHFGENIGRIVDLVYHDEALYTLDIVAGTVSRIFYAGPGQAPVANISSDIAFSADPVTVTLRADNLVNGSVAAAYHWDFGDGATTSTSEPTVTHFYPTSGDYTASVVIEDVDGQLSAPAAVLVQVYMGEMPEIELTNLTELTRTQFWGGDQFLYEAQRSTVADLDPQTPYSWRIDLLHNNHVHPLIVANETVSDTFDVSAENHGSVQINYRFQLFMHTATGQLIQTDKIIYPVTTTITIQADAPVTTTARLNGEFVPLPTQVETLVGIEQIVELPASILLPPDLYSFDAWTHDAQLTETTTLIAGPNDPVYTAVYTYTGTANQLWLPIVATPE